MCQAVRDFDVVHHAAPDDAHFAAILERDVDHLLNAVHRARKARDHDFLRRRSEQFLESRHNRAFRRRVARPLDVRAVAKERQHSLASIFRKRIEVERLAVHRRVINLEIAGMDDCSHRRAHCQRHTLNRAVRHVQKFDLERPDGDGLPRRDLAQIGVLEQSVLFELLLYQRQRKFRSIHRHVQIAENVRHGADMILMRVREQNRFHLLLALLQVGDVGDYDVHAEKLGLGEHQPGIDDDDFIAAAQGHHVHPELAEPAERDSPNRRITQFVSSLSRKKYRTTQRARRLLFRGPNLRICVRATKIRQRSTSSERISLVVGAGLAPPASLGQAQDNYASATIASIPVATPTKQPRNRHQHYGPKYGCRKAAKKSKRHNIELRENPPADHRAHKSKRNIRQTSKPPPTRNRPGNPTRQQPYQNPPDQSVRKNQNVISLLRHNLKRHCHHSPFSIVRFKASSTGFGILALFINEEDMLSSNPPRRMRDLHSLSFHRASSPK